MALAGIETSDDAIVCKNLDANVTSWNTGAERILGSTVEQAIGQPITTVIPQDRPREERAILTRGQLAQPKRATSVLELIASGLAAYP